MIKRALIIAFSFLGFCFPLMAQQTKRVERTKNEARTIRQLRPSALDTPARLTLSRPEFFNPIHGSVLTDDPLMLALLDREPLPASSEFDRMGIPPLDYFQDDLPSASDVEQANAATIDGKDSPSDIVSPPLSPIYYSGELGVFYGRSSGKFGREIMQTYFLGEVGNEKFHITVGAAYEESNGRHPRIGSFTGPR
jgi:hypothetical protein